MTIQVIGAGLGRTGTLSLKVALERLGFGPCYHMMEVIGAPERGRDWLVQTRDGSNAWDRIFDGYAATVDWPAAAFWRELVAHYPDAKVLLTRRDADRWYDSVMNTIYNAMVIEIPKAVPDHIRDFSMMVRELIFQKTFDGRLEEREYAKQVFEQHNQAVIDSIAPSKLLVCEPGDGWEPICKFLDVPIPGEDFPHVNDTAEFRARMGLPPLD